MATASAPGSLGCTSIGPNFSLCERPLEDQEFVDVTLELQRLMTLVPLMRLEPDVTRVGWEQRCWRPRDRVGIRTIYDRDFRFDAVNIKPR